MRIKYNIRPQAGPPVPMSRVRLFVVFAGILALAAMTFLRLINIQLIQHNVYETKASDQYTKKREIEPERGLIVDRQGNKLVVNLHNYWSVGVHPRNIENRDLLASKLADVLDLDEAYVRSTFDHSGNFVWVDRKVNATTAEMVRALSHPCIEVQRETLRRYPYDRTAGQVVGYVNVDNKGLNGIEKVFEDKLAGQSGWEVLQKDAWRQEILDPAFPKQNALDGGRIVLSIDMNAQAIAEEELQVTVEKYDATGGMIVVTRPYTGEILALASTPGYDPNEINDYPFSSQKNKALTDLYEPGSTFKVVAFAGMLERGLGDIDELIFCENGRYKVEDRVIRDTHKYAWLTARQVLEKSSNIGTAKIAERMSYREFYTLMRDFGFGQKTGISLPGEARGIVPKPSQWSGVSQQNMAMGHGIAVTALQLAMAYGSIANGGYLMKPILVLSATDQYGNVEIARPNQVRRVLRPSTSRTMRKLLTDAVELGTGTSAMIEGLQVAGKTGTAQKVDQENKTYFQDRYVSSFAGFLPADKPELLAVVVIDDPKVVYYGGAVAAPVFHKVMERLLVTLPRQAPGSLDEVNQDNEAEVKRQYVEVPSVVGLSKDVAIDKVIALGLNVDFIGQGGIISSQSIPPATEVLVNTDLGLVLCSSLPGLVDIKEIPDVRGLSMRKAVAALTSEGFDVEIEGSGNIVKQSPAAGKKMRCGETCKLVARRNG